MECIENVPHPLVLEGEVSQRTPPGQNASQGHHFSCRPASLRPPKDQLYDKARLCLAKVEQNLSSPMTYKADLAAVCLDLVVCDATF